MDTLIDVAILISTYASLSLFCAALLRLTWTESRRASDKTANTRSW